VTHVVLAERADADAVLLTAALRRRAPGAALLWADELLLGSTFTHRLGGGGGGVKTVLRCARGWRFDAARLRGAICRVERTLPPQFATAREADREYAEIESRALLLSWLASLPHPPLNRPSSRGLSGPALGPFEWQRLAVSNGLRCRRFRALAATEPPSADWQPVGGQPGLWAEAAPGPAERLLVVGERVLGEPGSEGAEGYLGLARDVGCGLLGIAVSAPGEAGERTFLGAEPRPALGGDEVAAVAELMVGPSR